MSLCNGRRVLRGLTLLAALVPLGCGGGGSGSGGGSSSNEQSPPSQPPTEVGLAIAGGVTEIHEWDTDTPVELTLTLSQAQPGDMLILFSFTVTGTARLGGDFEFEPEIHIPPGSTSGILRVAPIRDFEAEGDETIEIAIDTIQGNARAADQSSVSLTIIDQGALFENAKDNMYGKLYTFFDDPVIAPDSVEFVASTYNIGAVETSSTKLAFWASRNKSTDGPRLFFENADIPPIMPGLGYRRAFRVPLDEFPAPGTYYAVMRTDSPAEEAPGARRPEDFGGLVIKEDGSVRIRCPALPRNQSPGIEDPLRAAQWNLENSGQTAYANSSGVEGEDLRMTDTLAGGPTGKGVHVAVVDTGMEICHPDLASNVEAGASFNFNQGIWSGSFETDPFFPSTYGDHGTSAAGIIGAVADNGIGLRGVAPDVRLRAYNFLSTEQTNAAADSLGGSSSGPNSSDVDIFNMSFGGFGGEFRTLPQDRELFMHGVRDLRSGKGAIYVKAGGNGFGRCESMLRVDEITDRETGETDDYNINEEIGCVSVNSDPWNNLPYLIPVGAFDADGKKSDYSSAGAALWVSAPAGQQGIDDPAQITTDQMGTDQGYDALYSGLAGASGISARDNPLGDYVNSFNGTSAAAPNASGAVALLLEAEPDLTWRDVKYILARSARQIDPDIDEVKIGFGGEAAVLRHPWITNAAGYHFHNWYGFGAVDVDAALALVATHTPDSLGTFGDGVEVFEMATPIDIPDHRGGGVRQSVSVSGIDDALKVEGVLLDFHITHPFTNDLGIYLISPSGTESLLNPPFNEVLTANIDLDWELLSNAFYGESPLGDWTLKVVDAASGDVGRLESWSLTFYLGEVPPNS